MNCKYKTFFCPLQHLRFEMYEFLIWSTAYRQLNMLSYFKGNSASSSAPRTDDVKKLCLLLSAALGYMCTKHSFYIIESFAIYCNLQFHNVAVLDILYPQLHPKIENGFRWKHFVRNSKGVFEPEDPSSLTAIKYEKENCQGGVRKNLKQLLKEQSTSICIYICCIYWSAMILYHGDVAS